MPVRTRQLIHQRVNPMWETYSVDREDPPTDTIRTFEDLVVWQKGMALVKQIYLITDEGALKRIKDRLVK